ncbi:MAG: amidohydrolase family protein [Gemmatimonadota bacterium]
MRRFLIASVAAAGCTAQAAPTVGPSAWVLTHATVVDVVEGRLLPNRSIRIEDGRIVSVDSGAVAAADAFDLEGRFVIPGLIDTHVHVATDPAGEDRDARARLEWAFRSGVTSVRDMAGDARTLLELAAWAADSTVAAPRITYAALVAGPTFFDDPRPQASARGGVAGEVPWMQSVTMESDLPAVMRRARSTGATGLKLYADLLGGELAPLVAAAHEAGLAVWSHSVTYPGRPLEVVRSGADVVSHAYYLVWEVEEVVPLGYAAGRAALAAASGPVPDPGAPAVERVLAEMASRGTIFEPTLLVGSAGGPFARLQPFAAGVTRRARELGVRVVAGTDRMVDRETRRANLPAELALLVAQAGFTPAEALRAATADAAAALGQGNELGRVEPGRVADLVILDGDPLRDIAQVRSVRWVLKAGHRFEVR